MNNKRIRDDEDFDDEDTGPNEVLGYTVNSIRLNNFRVKLDRPVLDPSFYSRVFDMMLDASENDHITFFISCPGGRLDGLNVLLEGARLTEAHTTAVIVGSAYSAASIFALNCDEVVVTDSADMLCHEVTYGTGGKGSDVYSHVIHTKRTSEKLLTETYQGFLDPTELSSLLAGNQIYLTADEIRERLQRKADFLEFGDNPPQKEVKPKRAPKKKKEPSQA